MFIPCHLSCLCTPQPLSSCHQLHTWLAQCLFQTYYCPCALCKWNRKMCYGSWNYGTFQFSIFPFFLKSHIITHQKQRHILYFFFCSYTRTHSGKVTKLEIIFLLFLRRHTHNVKVTSREQKSESCKCKKQISRKSFFFRGRLHFFLAIETMISILV